MRGLILHRRDRMVAEMEIKRHGVMLFSDKRLFDAPPGSVRGARINFGADQFISSATPAFHIRRRRACNRRPHLGNRRVQRITPTRFETTQAQSPRDARSADCGIEHIGGAGHQLSRRFAASHQQGVRERIREPASGRIPAIRGLIFDLSHCVEQCFGSSITDAKSPPVMIAIKRQVVRHPTFVAQRQSGWRRAEKRSSVRGP
jgi:hypothetical protein